MFGIDDLFFLIAGGAYTFGKLLDEGSAKKVCDHHSDAWRALVIDRALEEDLRDFITKHENREAVWSEIQDAYQKMNFQKDYASANEWAYDGVLNKTKAGRAAYHRHRFEQPLDIMLAKRGKLRDYLSSLPIAYLSCGEGERTRANWDRTVEFWIYIRNELRNNGVDAELAFEPDKPLDVVDCRYFYVDRIDMFKYQSGKLRWVADVV